VDEFYAEVVALLREERARLDALAGVLLEDETLDQDEAYRAAGLMPPAETLPYEVAAIVSDERGDGDVASPVPPRPDPERG
jgi:cell division protease FtsH